MKIRLFILIIFLLIYCFTILAEISTVKDSDNNYSSHIFMYRDYPYNEIWKRFSNNPNRVPLNENGDSNCDGKPSFTINPITGFPEVVWSKFDGNDYEIAYSYFDGLEWSNHEIITDNNFNDFNPCIAFNNNGTLKITWWNDEPVQQVYYKIRKNSEDWSLKLRVSDHLEISRFPSIVALNNLSYISYETLTNQNNKDIYSANIDDDPDPHPTLTYRIKVGTSDFVSNSEPTPQLKDGHLWVDWIYDENFICWSEKIGNEWTPQRYERYSGPEDIIRTRLHVRMKVLNGQ